MLFIEFNPDLEEVKSYKRRFNINKDDNSLAFIIFFILGVFISVVSYILLANFNILWLKILLSVICIVFAAIEFIYVILDEYNYNPRKKLLITILFTVIYNVVVFLIIFIFMMIFKVNLTYDVIFYSIYSSPSFVVVIGLILLLLVGLSYA